MANQIPKHIIKLHKNLEHQINLLSTPRDTQTLLKLWHRNLYVANRDNKILDQNCRACKSTPESMLHLAECLNIWKDYWSRIIILLYELGMKQPQCHKAFIIFGRITNTKYIDPYRSIILFLAWRCLYAGIVADRLDNIHLNLDKIYKRTISL